MKLPTLLQPTTTEEMILPSGRIVSFPKSTPLFNIWQGEPIEDTYNGKAILDYEGRPAFAELVILWSMMAEGWQGCWIDTFRHRYLTGYWGAEPSKSLPQRPISIPDNLWNLAKARSGAWDVFCWRDDKVVFAESKRSKHDQIRASQLQFAESALTLGLSPESFLLVEWQPCSTTA